MIGNFASINLHTDQLGDSVQECVLKSFNRLILGCNQLTQNNREQRIVTYIQSFLLLSTQHSNCGFIIKQDFCTKRIT